MMKVSSIIILKPGSSTIKAYVILFVFFPLQLLSTTFMGLGVQKDKNVYCEGRILIIIEHN